MKKQSWIILIILTAMLSCPQISDAALAAGEVLAVKKSVYLLRDGTKTNAEPENELYMHDAVATAKQSRAKLFFHDDSILNLGELSRVEVKEYIQSERQIRSKSIYQLIDGSLKVVVGNSDLEIHTPTAVAAARGTKFILKTEKIGQAPKGTAQEWMTCLLVVDGEVEFQNINEKVQGMVTVKKDEMSCISTLNPPDGTYPADQKKKDEFNEATEVLGEFPETAVIGMMGEPAEHHILEEMGSIEMPPIDQQPIDGLTPVRFIIILP